MRLLLTRPQAESAALAEILRGRGIRVEIEPLLFIEPLADATVDLAGVQALLLTSANGGRALADAVARRDLPVLAVGDATAEAARDAGFVSVTSAEGNVEALADLVIRRLRPADGALLHAAGATVAGDLGGRLAAAGFDVRRVALYEARTPDALSPPIRRRLAGGLFDGVVFFSPRTAATFASLADKAGLGDACAAMAAFCLSPAVAGQARNLRWRAVVTADRPDQPSLLDAIAGMAAAGDSRKEGLLTPTMSTTPPTGDNRPAEDTTGPSAAEPAAEAGGPEAAAPESPPESPADATGRESPEAAPSPRRQSRLSGLARLLSTILIAAVVGAAVASWPFWWHSVEPYLPLAVKDPFRDPRVAALVQRVQALESSAQTVAAEQAKTEKTARASDDAIQSMEAQRARFSQQLDDVMQRIAALEKSTDAVRQMVEKAIQQGDGTSSAPLASRLQELQANSDDIKALSQRIKNLETTESTTSDLQALAAKNDHLAEEIGRIATRVGSLEKDIPAAENRAADRQALVLAVGQLRTALGGSGPYAKELQALKTVGGADPAVQQAVDALAPHADSGIPTLGSLRNRFDPLAGDIVHAASAPADSGWLSRAIDRVTGLVKIRRVSGFKAGDNSPDAVVARAGNDLRVGDLAGAVKSLKTLTGRAAEVAKPWLTDAETRLAAERAIATLHVHAIALLGTPAK